MISGLAGEARRVANVMVRWDLARLGTAGEVARGRVWHGKAWQLWSAYSTNVTLKRNTQLADSRRKKHKGPATARPRTETAEVSAPMTAGKIDRVERICDTLTSMFNRRQISQLQYGAGDRYRSAWEMTSASSGGSMDFERARGSSGLSPTPALTYLLAAEIVSEARKKLYPVDFAIVHRVSVIGLTIEQAAKQLYDARFDGEWPLYLRRAGMRFREGLDQMADMWWPDARSKIEKKTGEDVRAMRRMMTERPEVSDAVSVAPSSSVAHATRDKVYRGPQRRERV